MNTDYTDLEKANLTADQRGWSRIRISKTLPLMNTDHTDQKSEPKQEKGGGYDGGLIDDCIVIELSENSCVLGCQLRAVQSPLSRADIVVSRARASTCKVMMLMTLFPFSISEM